MNRREFISFSAIALFSYAIGAGCKRKTEAPMPSSPIAPEVPPAENLTVKNLQIAYEIETERMKRFAKYAEAADKEGKKKAAALLRGESQTQAIQRNHFSGALEKLNIKPVEPEIKEIEIADTIANIEKITGPDLDYKKTTFGGFKEQASKDNIDKAAIFFRSSIDADERNALLLKEALEALRANKELEGISYYICPVCGYINKGPMSTPCPVCKTPAVKFTEVK